MTISTEIVKIQRTLSRAVYKDAARLYRKGQLEAKFTKNTLKKGLFYAFFRFYVTGSAGENRKMSNLNSGGQNLSVEGYNITVSQFFEFMEGLFSVSAHCAPCAHV